MGLLYGRAGRLTAKNGGFRPGQNLQQLHVREVPGGDVLNVREGEAAAVDLDQDASVITRRYPPERAQ
jgi:hypothetical protein